MQLANGMVMAMTWHSMTSNHVCVSLCMCVSSAMPRMPMKVKTNSIISAICKRKIIVSNEENLNGKLWEEWGVSSIMNVVYINTRFPQTIGCCNSGCLITYLKKSNGRATLKRGNECIFKDLSISLVLQIYRKVLGLRIHSLSSHDSWAEL